MEKALRSRVIKLSKETAILLVAVIAAVALPQIVHGIGLFVGVGGMLGQILLPMYIPVLIIGFYRGPISGALTGFLAPLVSFCITGMPALAVLPYIMIELIAIGALAGLLAENELPAVLRVLLVQVVAKAIRLAAFGCNVYFATAGTLTAALLFGDVIRSVPGILLQLIVVTLLLKNKENDSDVR